MGYKHYWDIDLRFVTPEPVAQLSVDALILCAASRTTGIKMSTEPSAVPSDYYRCF